MDKRKRSASEGFLFFIGALMILSAVLSLVGQVGLIPGIPTGSMGVSIIDVAVSILVGVLAIRALQSVENMTKFIRGAWPWFPLIWDLVGIMFSVFMHNQGGVEFWLAAVLGVVIDLAFAFIALNAGKAMGVTMRSK